MNKNLTMDNIWGGESEYGEVYLHNNQQEKFK